MSERFEVPTVEQVEEMLISDELGGYAPGTEEMNIGKVLIFSAFVGESDQALSDMTGLTIDKVCNITLMLIENKVFGRELDHYKEYMEGNQSGIMLNCDIACAKGLLVRGCNEAGEATWQMTEAGMSDAEKMLRSNPAAQKIMDDLTAKHGMKPGEWKKEIKKYEK